MEESHRSNNKQDNNKVRSFDVVTRRLRMAFAAQDDELERVAQNSDEGAKYDSMANFALPSRLLRVAASGGQDDLLRTVLPSAQRLPKGAPRKFQFRVVM